MGKVVVIGGNPKVQKRLNNGIDGLSESDILNIIGLVKSKVSDYNSMVMIMTKYQNELDIINGSKEIDLKRAEELTKLIETSVMEISNYSKYLNSGEIVNKILEDFLKMREIVGVKNTIGLEFNNIGTSTSLDSKYIEVISLVLSNSISLNETRFKGISPFGPTKAEEQVKAN